MLLDCMDLTDVSGFQKEVNFSLTVKYLDNLYRLFSSKNLSDRFCSYGLFLFMPFCIIFELYTWTFLHQCLKLHHILMCFDKY